MVSGNLPTQLGLIATCHFPGTGAFSLAHRLQEIGRDSRAHRVTQTWVTSLFLTTSGQAGADQPYPSTHAWPQATQCPWVQ